MLQLTAIFSKFLPGYTGDRPSRIKYQKGYSETLGISGFCSNISEII